MSVTAKCVSRKKFSNHVTCTEFEYTYNCDGKKHEELSIVIKDCDLEVVWTVSLNHYVPRYQSHWVCEWKIIELRSCDEKIYGNLFVHNVESANIKMYSFNTNSLPFREGLWVECKWGLDSKPIKITIQIYRDHEVRSSLITDYTKFLMENEVTTDNQIIFIVGEELEEIPAHKNILSARSEVFATMLN